MRAGKNPRLNGRLFQMFERFFDLSYLSLYFIYTMSCEHKYQVCCFNSFSRKDRTLSIHSNLHVIQHLIHQYTREHDLVR